VYRLSNLPGINGDEAWYGVQALRLIAGQPILWRTPTTPWLNPFYTGLVLLVHLVASPSEWAIRLPGLISGLGLLAANYLAARKLFGRRTAVVSTVVLAVMPILIIYSRIGWDASQTPLAAALLLYASLGITRAPSPRPYVLLAALAYTAAVLIHSVNTIAGVLPAVAVCLRYARPFARHMFSGHPGRRIFRFTALAMLIGLSAWPLQYPLGEFNRVFGSIPSHVLRPEVWRECALGFIDVLSGAGAYLHTAGTRGLSWLYLPVYCALILGATAVFLITFRHQTRTDRVLWLSTAAALLAFLAITGTMGFWPKRNRYALFLLPPVALCFSRSLLVVAAWLGRRHRPKLLAACLLFAALVLADCYMNAFHFIKKTGGRAWRTFTAAEVDPKFDAARYIMTQISPNAPVTIYPEDWWVRTPAEYYTVDKPKVQVIEVKVVKSYGSLIRQSASRDIWLILYPDRETFRDVTRALRREGATVRVKTFQDYAGNPVVAAVHVAAP